METHICRFFHNFYFSLQGLLVEKIKLHSFTEYKLLVESKKGEWEVGKGKCFKIMFNYVANINSPTISTAARVLLHTPTERKLFRESRVRHDKKNE